MTVYRLKKRYQENGDIRPDPHGGGTPPIFRGRCLERLCELVARHPDATLEELRDMCGVCCSVVTIHNTLKRVGLRLKKSHSTPPSRTETTSSNSAGTGP